MWRILSVLGPALLGTFNRDVYEGIDDRISFQNDLSWMECWYEINKLKFKSGRCKVQYVKSEENWQQLKS